MPPRIRIPRTRRTVHHTLRLQPGPWRWAAGVRSALAIGLPLLAFTLLGAQEHGMVAAMGGFTALYGTERPWRTQFRLLPAIALGMVAAAALGSWAASDPWHIMGALVLVTTLAGYGSWGYRIGPPGALLFVLVAAISAHAVQRMPATLIPPLVALGAAMAMLVVAGIAVVQRRWLKDPALKDDAPLHFRVDRSVRHNVGRITVGVALACLVSLTAEPYRLHWVVVTALAILQGAQDRSFTLVRVVQRILGTWLGLLVFQAVMQFTPTGIQLVLVVMTLQFGIEVVIFRNYMLGLLFITPLALSLASFGLGHSPSTALNGRWMDTLWGGAVALAVLLVVEARARLTRTIRPE